ncbi:MAG: Spy/CpxP family protein refolding chaperone [Gemmatimonadota bacterium]
MLRAFRFLVLIPFLLIASPAAGQDSPDVERLEHLRFERLQEALELNEEQVEALRSNIDEFRRQNLESRETQLESLERLRQALESDDEAHLQEALTDLERRRAETRERQAQHEERLTELLRPEQQARFLLFHHRFDTHLRELIHRHRGGLGGPECPPVCNDSLAWHKDPMPVVPPPVGPPGDRMHHVEPFERHLESLSPEEQREHLRERIRALERQLQELEAAEGGH